MNSAYFLVLKALFRNKFRFADGTSTNKKVGLILLFSLAYLFVLAYAILLTVFVGGALAENGMSTSMYFLILLIASTVVLIFGIIYLVSTLFLSNDTDFYSALPIKQSVVFSAKITFIYLCEAMIVIAVALPAIIVFGIVSRAWGWYYLISFVTLPIVPALPLMVAAIISIPVMYIAGKLKHRNIVPLILYSVLFIGFFVLYFLMMFNSSQMSESLTPEQIDSYGTAASSMMYVFYPFSCLSCAAFGKPMFGLSVGASVAVELVIFFGISLALVAILLLLGKLMYSQSAKANNQTSDSKAKKGTYKSSSSFFALVKREYFVAMRTTSTTFQSFVVFLLPIVFGVVICISFGNMSFQTEDGAVELSEAFTSILAFSIILIMMSTMSNAAITTFSREGTAISALKTLPVGIKQIVLSKTFAWSVLAVPTALVSAVIVNCFFFDLLQLFLSLFAFAVLAFVSILFGVLWDLSSPKLKWNDPIQAIKHNTHATIGQFIGIGVGLFILMISMVVFPFSGANETVLKAVFWSLVFVAVIAFAVTDAVMFAKIDKYYNRLEV